MTLAEYFQKAPRAQVEPCDCPQDGDCGVGCQARQMSYECCNTTCSRHKCTNRVIQKAEKKGLNSNFVVFRTPTRGLGLASTKDIPKGKLVIVYIGECLTLEDAHKREVEYSQEGMKDVYMVCLGDCIVDATRRGSLGRFVNHSCMPNCVMQVRIVQQCAVYALFALEDIPAMREITFDYQYTVVAGGVEPQRCLCAAPNCKGYIYCKVDRSSVSVVFYKGFHLTFRKVFRLAGKGTTLLASERAPQYIRTNRIFLRRNRVKAVGYYTKLATEWEKAVNTGKHYMLLRRLHRPNGKSLGEITEELLIKATNDGNRTLWQDGLARDRSRRARMKEQERRKKIEELNTGTLPTPRTPSPSEDASTVSFIMDIPNLKEGPVNSHSRAPSTPTNPYRTPPYNDNFGGPSNPAEGIDEFMFSAVGKPPREPFIFPPPNILYNTQNPPYPHQFQNTRQHYSQPTLPIQPIQTPHNYPPPSYTSNPPLEPNFYRQTHINAHAEEDSALMPLMPFTFQHTNSNNSMFSAPPVLADPTVQTTSLSYSPPPITPEYSPFGGMSFDKTPTPEYTPADRRSQFSTNKDTVGRPPPVYEAPLEHFLNRIKTEPSKRSLSKTKSRPRKQSRERKENDERKTTRPHKPLQPSPKRGDYRPSRQDRTILTKSSDRRSPKPSPTRLANPPQHTNQFKRKRSPSLSPRKNRSITPPKPKRKRSPRKFTRSPPHSHKDTKKNTNRTVAVPLKNRIRSPERNHSRDAKHKENIDSSWSRHDSRKQDKKMGEKSTTPRDWKSNKDRTPNKTESSYSRSKYNDRPRHTRSPTRSRTSPNRNNRGPTRSSSSKYQTFRERDRHKPNPQQNSHENKNPIPRNEPKDKQVNEREVIKDILPTYEEACEESACDSEIEKLNMDNDSEVRYPEEAVIWGNSPLPWTSTDVVSVPGGMLNSDPSPEREIKETSSTSNLKDLPIESSSDADLKSSSVK